MAKDRHGMCESALRVQAYPQFITYTIDAKLGISYFLITMSTRPTHAALIQCISG
jgi:hypothetical protein